MTSLDRRNDVSQEEAAVTGALVMLVYAISQAPTVGWAAIRTLALTGGFQWAFWVTGLTALAAVPVTFLLIRRTELARGAAASPQREPSVAAAG